ncbi:putative alcohol dehydrogenase [Aspergillus bombycis]|uniref:Putative alcohol dehydrogenase n=1 Tax=Aspergillus bombycis TaxID=109264 RepID=A0A1F8ABU2_9EURO|nr:putative alcohol dehydrogenase [Aspergillus bombycis]OGM49184.1 putative alcohol dehydrogenase [Aspergillus bombycis]
MLNTTLDTGTVRATLKTTPLMEAVRFHGPRDIRVETIDEPICGKGEVKIRPAFAGLCGSDIHEHTGGPVLIPQEPHNITGRSCPVTLGHEFSGIVEEVGEGVAHVSPGQRVVVRPTIFDRQCTACKRGYEHCCENIGFIGLSGYGGGLAKYHVASVGHFYPIPDNVSLEAAALIEPLAVAWHAVDRSSFKMGDNVMVVGGGPVGIGIVQVLKLQGAKNIMLSELYDKRRRFASEYGATHTFDPVQEDVTQRVMEVTDSVGADVIFDAAGVEKALNSVIGACRTHGTIINVAVWENKPAIPVNDLMYIEVNYTGSALYDEGSFEAVIKALGYGQLQPEKMVTSKIKLNETVEKGLETLANDREDHCKILIDVQA